MGTIGRTAVFAIELGISLFRWRLIESYRASDFFRDLDAGFLSLAQRNQNVP